jgi:hypothetical protein
MRSPKSVYFVLTFAAHSGQSSPSPSFLLCKRRSDRFHFRILVPSGRWNPLIARKGAALSTRTASCSCGNRASHLQHRMIGLDAKEPGENQPAADSQDLHQIAAVRITDRQYIASNRSPYYNSARKDIGDCNAKRSHSY